MESSVVDLNERYRHLKFLGSGLSTSSGRIMFIINESAGTPQNIQFEVIEKAPQREALAKLRRTLRARGDIDDTELFIMGDWNFVEDKMDSVAKRGLLPR